MSLAPPAPLTRAALWRFDLLVSLPIAVGVLHRQLGLIELLGVLLRYELAMLRDPLRHLPTAGWEPERELLVRHQLRAAVRLDDALSTLAEERRLPLLAQVLAEVGAAFIQQALPMPRVQDWVRATPSQRRGWLEGAVSRFFNTRAEVVAIEPDRIGFDVTACRFVGLCTALQRPWLAPMLCAADAVYFQRPESPVRLDRSVTLATGGEVCDFRFTFRE